MLLWGPTGPQLQMFGLFLKLQKQAISVNIKSPPCVHSDILCKKLRIFEYPILT
jgi:hypothetical protein